MKKLKWTIWHCQRPIYCKPNVCVRWVCNSCGNSCINPILCVSIKTNVWHWRSWKILANKKDFSSNFAKKKIKGLPSYGGWAQKSLSKNSLFYTSFQKQLFPLNHSSSTDVSFIRSEWQDNILMKMAGSNILNRKQFKKIINNQLTEFGMKLQNSIVTKQTEMINDNKEFREKLCIIASKFDKLKQENKILKGKVSVAGKASLTLSANYKNMN